MAMPGSKTIGLTAFAMMAAYVAVNALFLQPVMHKAPLAPLQKSASLKPPIAERRPVSTPIAQPSVSALVPAKPKAKPKAKAKLKLKAKPKRREVAVLDKSALHKHLLGTNPRKNRIISSSKPAAVKSGNLKSAPIKISSNSPAGIRLVQIGLGELGYDVGPVDGALGQQTVKAIRQFEADRKLAITGRISKPLIEELRKVTGTSILSVL